ncbi:hypothetical protein F5B17DRAFT_216347 [Nemania serpens]|nr:hypothetical protein F5B17DRAFT_216347 [Nemania serpens]
MCVITVLRRYGGGEGPTLTEDHDIDTSICLLGKYCTVIGYSLTIFQDPMSEVCTDCDMQNKISTAYWSLSVRTPTPPEPPRCAKRPPPPGEIRIYNDTVLMELKRNLGQCTSFGQCRALLHYILSLPGYIEKVPLIDAFAKTVGSWCGHELGRELSKIVSEHGFGREFGPALQSGLQVSKRE